ncbi:hypothetical protein HK100_001748 [Physocladia obscura]|uniref:Uncharacterized protein n=1 Tax=Physocladia obscura TaxID=109957 RepID=A0AAD5XK59_9FUNG|nr:hypothetical protein HK100_001748 [Physocladia obscura]
MHSPARSEHSLTDSECTAIETDNVKHDEAIAAQKGDDPKIESSTKLITKESSPPSVNQQQMAILQSPTILNSATFAAGEGKHPLSAQQMPPLLPAKLLENQSFLRNKTPSFIPIPFSIPISSVKSIPRIALSDKAVTLLRSLSSSTLQTFSHPVNNEVNSKPKKVSQVISEKSATKFASSNLIFKILIFRKILLLNDGRDKILKVIQYSAKVLLWVKFLSILPVTARTRKSLAKMIPHLSVARKLIRFGSFLAPIEFLSSTSPDASPAYLFNFFSNINALLTNIADDNVTLAKIGLKDQNPFFDTWADRLWLIGIGFDVRDVWDKLNATRRTLVDLHEKRRVLILQLDQSMSAEICKVSESVIDDDETIVCSGDTSPSTAAVLIAATNEKICDAELKIWISQLTLAKLVADCLFCSFDVFGVVKQVEKMRGPAKQLQHVQDLAGLTAACLGTWKLFSTLSTSATTNKKI